MANIISHRYRVTPVRTISDIASLTTGTGKVDPPHIADRFPLPRESQSRTRNANAVTRLRHRRGRVWYCEAQALSYTAVYAIVVSNPWHPEGLQSTNEFKMKCSTPGYLPYRAH